MFTPVGSDDPANDITINGPTTIRCLSRFEDGVCCSIACFHTVDDACSEHLFNRDALRKALNEVVESLRRPVSENPAFRSGKLICVKSFPAKFVIFEMQATTQAEVQTTEGFQP